MDHMIYRWRFFVAVWAAPLAIASTKLLSRDATLLVNNVQLPDTHGGYKVIRTEVIVRTFHLILVGSVMNRAVYYVLTKNAHATIYTTLYIENAARCSPTQCMPNTYAEGIFSAAKHLHFALSVCLVLEPGIHSCLYANNRICAPDGRHPHKIW